MNKYRIYEHVLQLVLQYGLTKKIFFLASASILFVCQSSSVSCMRFLMIFTPEIRETYYLTFLSDFGVKLEVGSRLCLWVLFGYRMDDPSASGQHR